MYENCGGSFSFLLTAIPDAGYPAISSIVWYDDNNNVVAPSSTDPFSILATTTGSYYAVTFNGSCYYNSPSCLIYCPSTCPELENTIVLGAANDCGTVTAGSSHAPAPNLLGYHWSSDGAGTLQSQSEYAAVFAFESAGHHSITYSLSYQVGSQVCTVQKTIDQYVPYVGHVGKAVSCGTGDHYTVTVTDLSSYAPDVAAGTVAHSFTVNGVAVPQGSGDTATTRILSLDPDQTYTIALTVGAGTNPPCTISVPVTLPALPNPNFRFDPDNVCQYSAMQFNSVPQTGVTYLWSFGDVSTNLQANPYREYNAKGIYQPKLTVTDRYGCSRSLQQNVNVRDNSQNGTIDTPSIGCPGTGSNLHFDGAGIPTVTSYQWLFNNEPIADATYNDYIAYQTGSYSIIVGNSNGCTRKLPQSVPVAVPTPPFSQIIGPHYTCPGGFTLAAGSNDPTLLYSWTRQDQPETVLSTTATMTDDPPYGDYNYILQVSMPMGGETCTFALAHDVKVERPPVLISSGGGIDNCHPFTVLLYAQADPPGGVYNWSDGQTGETITENEGGAYEVTYTAPSGCKVSKLINVAKNPEEFLWVFPYGCYAFCKLLEGHLVGPEIAAFAQWAWYNANGFPPLLSTEAGAVDPYTPVADQDGTYKLLLQAGDCAVKSKEMRIDIVDCECRLTANVLEHGFSNEPYAHYIVKLHVDNPIGTAMPMVFTAPDNIGIVAPGSAVIPAAGGDVTLWIIPDSGFNGGTIPLHFTSNTSRMCYGDVSFLQAGAARPAADGTRLLLSPNPAREQTAIVYDYADTAWRGAAELSLYDLYGRLLDRFVPTDAKGSWTPDLSAYPAGNYIAVMKLGGQILNQKRLVLTH